MSDWSQLLQTAQKEEPSVENALDILDMVKQRRLAADRLRKETDRKSFVFVMFKLREALSAKEGEEFAENFLAADGFEILLTALSACAGFQAQQAEMLKVLRVLLPYKNAIDQLTESRGLVDRIYALLRSDDGGIGDAKWQKKAKEVLEILIVTVGATEKGHDFVHEAACHVSQGERPYEVMCPMLKTQDLTLIALALVFLNILVTKRTQGAGQSALQELVGTWRRCGLLDAMTPLTQQEDADIRSQLTVFQKLTGHIIPLGEYAAREYDRKRRELLRKAEQSKKDLKHFQSSLPRAAVMGGELQRVEETLGELQRSIAGLSDEEVQRLVEQSRGWTQVEEAGAVDEYRVKAFRDIALTPQFKSKMMEAAKQALGAEAKWGTMTRAARPVTDPDFPDDGMGSDSDFSSDEEETRRIRDNVLARLSRRPPSDTSSEPSIYTTDSDEPGPPPEEGYDGEPPIGEPPIWEPDGEPLTADKLQEHQAAVAAGELPPPPDGAAQPGAAGPTGEAAPGAAAGTGAAAQPVAGHADPSVPAPPPPPPSGDGKGVAPPPPPTGGGVGKAPPPPPGGGGGKKPAAKPGGRRPKGPPELKLEWYRGPKPTKKMKVVHWDKYPLTEDPFKTLWHRVHPEIGGDLDCSYDYEQLETLFSNKVGTEKKQKEKKKEVITLMDGRKFQNLSIMLHKMPPLAQIERAVQTLDGAVLDREKLEMLIAGVPTEDEEKEFRGNMGKKPEDEYEPPEQFFAMVMNSLEFTKRCKAWIFTLDWDELVENAVRPMQKLQAASDAILGSKHLPYVMGLILGFGNILNHGHAQRGNAGAFGYPTLSKLEITKDARGKVNLLQHLINTCRDRRPDSLELADELDVCLKGVQAIKLDEVDKNVGELEGGLKKFKMQVKQVKDKLAAAGLADADPFGPQMVAFYNKAEEEYRTVDAMRTRVKDTFVKVLEYWAAPAKTLRKPEPDDFFSHLCPFLEKFGRGAADILKERRREKNRGHTLQVKKGQGSDEVEQLAAGIKEALVAG